LWKRGVVGRSKRLDPSSRRSTLLDHQQARRSDSVLAAFPADLEAETELPIKRCEHRLLVRDHGFDFDDQDDPFAWVPSEDVNGTSLSANPERHLDRDIPSVGSQHPGDGLDNARVLAIEQSIERLPVPAEPEVGSSAKDLRNAVQVAHGHRVRLTELDPNDLRAADVRGQREVDLAPFAPHPEGTDRPIMAAAAQLPLTGRTIG
jgi:hypothetical protein